MVLTTGRANCENDRPFSLKNHKKIPGEHATPGDSFYICGIGTVSSAGLERCLDRAEVAGSNPARFTTTETLSLLLITSHE